MDLTEPTLTIEAVGPKQWDRVRALRLASLREDPQSFFKLLSEEIGLTEDEWRARLASVNTWVAVLDGVDVGVVTSSPDRENPTAAHLSGLWVAPAGRRRRTAVALSGAVVERAGSEGFRRVVLWVASANHGADALYAGLGFTRTGRTDTFKPPRDLYTEWELELLL
ncbi:GNAT family N-acetyltransferase [Candidatus Microthrix parvicella]|uniref:GNAT family N-acetyltransferase n=1 Tax=Candidatus Neomicrothrix parvicella TaxID=41950 RepID=UPI00035CA904|nr:GNAT family N-acetyltransferase [Candidatus Microthrix parvicella]